MTLLIPKLIRSIKNCWQRLSAAGLLFIFLFSISSPASAEPLALQIKPTKCIALHEGQECYQTLKISWQADAADEYCLISPERKDPWHCWSAMQSARLELEFENANSQIFKLVRTRDQKILGEVTIEVAWVYKADSHRESHWRVF